MTNISENFISIQDASSLVGKSIQTLRRAIKAKKIKVRKSKTPQGFNYLIEKGSLCEFYAQNDQKEIPVQKETVSQVSENKPISDMNGETLTIQTNDFKTLVKTLEGLLNQHSEERQNFLRLVNTMQEKIFVLENQLNLLKAPAKKWYHLWK